MRSLSRWRFVRRLAGLLVMLAAATVDGNAQAQIGRDIPSGSYFKTFTLFYNGDYNDALASFQSEARGAIKSPDSRWIDSICYHAMAGECYYQVGRYQEALEQYNIALKLYLAFPSWMLRVDFSQPIQPVAHELPGVPWGQRKRLSRIGEFRDTLLIGQGQINNNDVIQRGGVVQSPLLIPIHASEIVRCTTLAMRHRREIMGPLCRFDPMTSELVTALSRRPAPPNSWAQAWVDVQLGVAFAAAGNPQAVQALERGLVAAGEFDHPLTSTALVELGRLAIEAGNLPAAGRFFEEATYSSVYFFDAGILEEAFRYGQLTHLLSNAKGIYPPLLVAGEWAKLKGYRQLQASLLVLAAENLAIVWETPKAAALVAEARAVIGSRTMGAGPLGARLNHVASMAAYQANNMAVGDQALAAALAFQRTGSLWLFQIGMADTLASAGQLSERSALATYGLLLRDPAPADWATNPLESLSVMSIPHVVPYEHWLEIALRRSKEQELALEISDRLKRHRFYSTLPVGGRLLALRWILEGPRELLSERAFMQRQDLLLRYPRYEQLVKQTQAVRAKLAETPAVVTAADALREQSSALDSLSAIGQEQERILRQIAVRHEPADLIFPPLRSTRDIQKSLPPGHVLLAFAATSTNLHAFMFSNEKYALWKLGSVATLQKQLSGLLREMGNSDQNRELSQTDLNQTAWKKTSARIVDLLFDKSNVDLSLKFEELVVVPDGFVWYLPFEALEVGRKGDQGSLLSRVRVRYAPTVGLAVPYPRIRKPKPNVGVILGRLSPKDDEAVAREAFEEMSRSVPGSVAFPILPPAATPLYRSLFDGLIVLDDIKPSSNGPYGWSPATVDRGKRAAPLATWFNLPWGGPEDLILPGFHTPAENGMKKGLPGNDLFLSVCGLMSTGVRTILISRWRTGGQSSFDLVREFAQELPHTSAADAWQRSVQVVTESVLTPAAEPRLKRTTADTPPPKANHPFFWAGYMVVDSGIAAKPVEGAEDPPELDFNKKLKPARGAAARAVDREADVQADGEDENGDPLPLTAVGEPPQVAEPERPAPIVRSAPSRAKAPPRSKAPVKAAK